tara:strand:- start:274 stop:891 length:618 start_codon:yes stop_codon:yes gene_type:complete
MNFAFRSISFTLLKLLLVVLSFAFINPILAEENLYDRGKELVEQKEYQKAIKAFEFASKAGNLDALTALGVMYIGGIGVEQNNTKGYQYIREAADMSDPKAQYTLGALYYLGAGVKKDYKKAFNWLNLASEQNYIDAKYNLAVMYEFGEGVDQSYEKAYEYYLFAARRDNLESQIKLASMYRDGIGTDKDLDKSAYWLKRIEDSK